MLLDARRVIVTGGSYWGYWEAPLQMGEGSRVVGAALECVAEVCVTARGSSLIRDCTFTVGEASAPAIAVSGDGTIVDGNVLDNWVAVYGNHNVVARNLSSNGNSYIEVNGSGNVVVMSSTRSPDMAPMVFLLGIKRSASPDFSGKINP